MKLKSFRELTVWQRAHELVLKVFRMTERFPRSDQFGIVAQVRRASSSVTANIAEGFGRGTTREFLRSLQIARGELEETRYFMLLSGDLGRITKEEFEDVNVHCDSVGQLINALGRALRGKLQDAGDPRVTNHKSRVTLRN
ncbi:MAG TPA: four helix bundle protein [Candidatus Acidoferrum sp.]|nr:four helix bundle protein [Candidatus Acidoferrum sp.]